jgi:adenylylsulfate kinase-like enzyme
MTGIGQEYEAPESAELVLDGTIPVIDNVKIILETML